MNYRLRSSEPARRPTKKYALIALACMLAAVLLLTAFSSSTSNSLLSLAAPLWKAGNRADSLAAATEGVVKSKSTLLRENQALESRSRDLELELAGMRDLEAENAELRAILGLVLDERTVVAAVLATPPRSPYDSLVLEIGEGQAVSSGDPIYAGSSILIGEVAEVHGRQVLGRLYSSAGTEISAVIERNGVTHAMVGTGGGNFEIKVPREVDIEAGDRLMLPGIVPKLLGDVREIETSPTDSFKKAFIKSPVNIFQLRWVTIGERAAQ